MMPARIASICAVAAWLVAGSAPATGDDATASARVPIVDTHALPARAVRRALLPASQVLAAMDEFGIALTVLLPPPFPAGHPGRYDPHHFDHLVRSAPERFAIVDGGAS